MTVAHDPKQAIIDDLCHPRSTSSGIDPAVEETIRFLRHYSLSQRQLHLVTYEDINGKKIDYIVDVSQNESGNWQVNGSSGFLHEKFLRKEPSYSFPWVHISGNGWGNLGNGWGNHFSAGGYLTSNALSAERVCLIFKNGVTLEDHVQDDTVLFITEQKVQVPVQVEVYNGSGELLGTQIAFDYESMTGKPLRKKPKN